MEPAAPSGDTLLVGPRFGALRWPKTRAVVRPAVPGSGGDRARLVACLAGEDGKRAGGERVSLFGWQPANGSRFLRAGCPRQASSPRRDPAAVLLSLLQLGLAEAQGHGAGF